MRILARANLEHQFREFLIEPLESRFKQEEIAILHIRASNCFVQNDFIDTGINHALAAGDISSVAQLIE